MFPTKPTIGTRREKPKKQEANPFLLPVMLLGVGAVLAQMSWTQKNKYLFAPFSIDVFVCDTCDRRGVVQDPADGRTLVICPICFGVGRHDVRRIDTDDSVCPACDGMGRLLDPTPDDPLHARTCERCDGRGLTRPEAWSGRPEDVKLAPPRERGALIESPPPEL